MCKHVWITKTVGCRIHFSVMYWTYVQEIFREQLKYVETTSYLYNGIHRVATWLKSFIIHCCTRKQLLNSTFFSHPHTCGVVSTTKALSSTVGYFGHHYLRRQYRALLLAVLHRNNCPGTSIQLPRHHNCGVNS